MMLRDLFDYAQFRHDEQIQKSSFSYAGRRVELLLQEVQAQIVNKANTTK